MEWVGKRYIGSLVLWALYMFGCISLVVVEGDCVKDCRVLGLCTVCIVG
jgi:hypothetical protein